MIIEPLDLKHQSLLDLRFKKLELDISEYTFANAYLFRREHNFEVIQGQDVYLKGKTRDGLCYLMPTVPVDLFNWPDLEKCLQGCDFLFPIPESWVEHFDAKKYQSTQNEADSDYLYTVNKLSNFPGRHLSGRRNLLRQFKDLYPNHSSMPLTLAQQSDAKSILDEWQKTVFTYDKFTDYTACLEALQLMEPLRLSGHISYVDGKPAGFILGEELNPKTFVIHFAKALRQYKGIYQYIYQELAHSLEGLFESINLEQDLGVADLQHSKRAYEPDQLIPKLRISLWKPTAS